jgi:hypothetical protein
MTKHEPGFLPIDEDPCHGKIIGESPALLCRGGWENRGGQH